MKPHNYAWLILSAGLFLADAAGPGRLDAQTSPPPAAVPPAATSPAAAQSTSSGSFVNFNFDQVDIRFLVKLVGDLTGRRFVIDKVVEGKITVVTPPQIPISEIYPLFLSILEANGCALVERDGFYHVVARERRPTPIAPVVGAAETAPMEGVITKVIHVSYLNAADLRKILEPMIGDGKAGGLGILEATNHLIVTDTAESIRRVEKIIEQLDKPGLARITEIYPLKSAAAQDLANELNQAIDGAVAKPTSQGERLSQRLPRPEGATAAAGEAVVVAAPHSNSLILVGTAAQVADLKRLIEHMDIEPQAGHGHLKAIFLNYMSSDEAAKNLNALFAKSVDKTKPQKIAIESSLANNALLVEAAPQDFEMVREVIAQLDHPPQQVLVEVMIAELTTSKGRDIGAEIVAAGNPAQDATTIIGGSRASATQSELLSQVLAGVVPNGLTFGIAKGSYTDANGNVVPRVPFLININAIDKNAKFKVLSNIPLWAQNNQEAKVTVGKNIPILKSTISAGAGTARDIIQNIDRIDVGIKLAVTPHINPSNEVMMKLNPSIEAVLEESTGGLAFTPTIAKREVTTTVTVPDGDTIIISGLIREDTVHQVRKVPFLGAIPLLGWLFKHNVETVERTNLLIFVTPRVATNLHDTATITGGIVSQTAFDAGIRTNIPKPVEEK